MRSLNLFSILLIGTLSGSILLRPVGAESLRPMENYYPKNVILLIGDGMGLGQIEIARQFEYGQEGVLNLEKLEHTALMRTYSANKPVTDSAAGGTALATGVKTNNEMIGLDVNGMQVDSVLDAFKAAGKKTGLISTNMVVDATPAAFGASVTNRWTGLADIAQQLLQNKIDVILGGGAVYFSPEKQNGVNLLKSFQAKGYTITSDAKELNTAPNTGRLLGLFHPEYMNFKQDKDEYHSKEPTLAEMTSKALKVLSKDGKGFFLMSEGARIDQASHAADIPGIWKETIEFDNTIKLATDWAKKRGDTLVVVLADHETMGISATEPMNITALKEIKVSPYYMASKLKYGQNKTLDSQAVKVVFKTYAHLNLSDKEINHFIKTIQTSTNGVYPKNKIQWEIGSVIAKHYHAGVIDSTVRSKGTAGGHTANMVPVFATGPGSESIHGVIDNTDISRIITKAARIPFTPGTHQPSR